MYMGKDKLNSEELDSGDSGISSYGRFILAVFACSINSGFSLGYNLSVMHALFDLMEDWMRDYRTQNDTVYYYYYDDDNKLDDGNLMDESDYERLYEAESKRNFVIQLDKCTGIETAFGLGALFGVPLIRLFSRTYGRRGGMLMANLFSVTGILLGGYAKYFHYPWFVLLGRLLLGVECSLNAALGPMYLMEISPQQIRGQVAATYSFFNQIGGLAGVTSSVLLLSTGFWPLTFSLNIIPMIIQLTLLPLVPESPKYLYVIKKKDLESRKAIRWLRGRKPTKEEMEELKYEYRQYHTLGEINIKALFNHPVLVRALLITTLITISKPCCGIRLMIKFKINKYGDIGSVYKVIGFYLICTIFSIPVICMADKFSRRKLIYNTFAVMGVFCLILSFILTLDVPLIIAKCQTYILLIIVIASNCGCGWMSPSITSEYFNTATAPLAYSIGLAFSWAVITIESLYTERLEKVLRGYLIINYAICNMLLSYCTYKFVLDSRNKSIKQLYNEIYEIIMRSPTKEK